MCFRHSIPWERKTGMNRSPASVLCEASIILKCIPRNIFIYSWVPCSRGPITGPYPRIDECNHSPPRTESLQVMCSFRISVLKALNIRNICWVVTSCSTLLSYRSSDSPLCVCVWVYVIYLLTTGRTVLDRMPVGTRFSAPVQTGPGAHPVFCKMGTGSFQGVKTAGVCCSPLTPSSVAVMEE